jgi:hypothetical protein
VVVDLLVCIDLLIAALATFPKKRSLRSLIVRERADSHCCPD